MTNILKNLQNKPESVRHLIMWFGVIFIMSAIFIFWLLTFPSSIPAMENDKTNLNLDKIPGVWQSLKDLLGNLKDMRAIPPWRDAHIFN